MKRSVPSSKVNLNLEHFKKILLAKREKVKEELDILKNKIAKIEAEESKSFEYISEYQKRAQKRKQKGISAKEINSLLYEQAIIYFVQINEALDRIEDGTYGICRRTYTPIPVKQLEAVPHTSCRIEYRDKILWDREQNY